MNAADVKRLYFNTVSDYTVLTIDMESNQFIMAFDLTSAHQQASHDFIQPQLTSCSISIELKFSAAFLKILKFP